MRLFDLPAKPSVWAAVVPLSVLVVGPCADTFCPSLYALSRHARFPILTLRSLQASLVDRLIWDVVATFCFIYLLLHACRSVLVHLYVLLSTIASSIGADLTPTRFLLNCACWAVLIPSIDLACPLIE
jgi:hypothetical protein